MSERDVGQLHSADDLIAAVEQYGFLPFFRNEIHGFSIEELCPPELWFADDVDGPWEWKGPAARSGKCLYGKLFNKKAGFVSREWIPDFANFRRDGYDFDARWDDGLASYKDKELYESIRSDKSYKPSKPTVIAFAIALELPLSEMKDMLMKAGFALSHSNKFDIIVEYFVEHGNYNVFEINEALFAFDQSLLGA